MNDIKGIFQWLKLTAFKIMAVGNFLHLVGQNHIPHNILYGKFSNIFCKYTKNIYIYAFLEY